MESGALARWPLTVKLATALNGFYIFKIYKYENYIFQNVNYQKYEQLY